MIGKNIADIVAMELDGTFHSVAADVLSGCTVHVSEFVEVLNSSFKFEIK